MPAGSHSRTVGSGAWPRIFAVLTGAWLGLSLLKFGNPVILERLVEPPKAFWEFVFSPWPVAWGYGILAVLMVVAAGVIRFKTAAPRWRVVALLAWFGWQLVAATQTVDVQLTKATALHFAACVVCFYLGLFALGRVASLTGFWIGLLLGFAWVLWMGFGQHFGGLAATQLMIYEQPGWQQFSPEYLQRMASNRIFSTLVYPNALAGAVLLLLPMLLAALSQMTRRMANVTRGVLVGLLGYAGLACLYWSGSKSGWLIALLLGLITLLRLPLQRQIKLAVVAAALALGLAGFLVKLSEYFERGATSVSARFDYWRAAWQIAKDHPLFGTGPGTFSIPYKKLKAPGSEMTRLVHNNYLEQASDSGLFGFLTFSAFIFGSITLLYRKSSIDSVHFCVWLGLLGWTLHGVVEFGLYIPALAWPAFVLLGWLSGAELKSTRTN